MPDFLPDDEESYELTLLGRMVTLVHENVDRLDFADLVEISHQICIALVNTVLPAYMIGDAVDGAVIANVVGDRLDDNCPLDLTENEKDQIVLAVLDAIYSHVDLEVPDVVRDTP